MSFRRRQRPSRRHRSLLRACACVFYSCTIQSCNKSPVPKITDYNPVFTSRGALRAPVVLPDDLCARRGVLLVLLVATETCFLLPLARNGLQRGLVLGLDEIFRVLGHPPELLALVLQQKVAVSNLRGRRARRRASDQSPGEKRGGGGGVVETRTHRVSEATLRHRRVPRLALPVERLEIETSPSVSPWKGERTLFLFMWFGWSTNLAADKPRASRFSGSLLVVGTPESVSSSLRVTLTVVTMARSMGVDRENGALWFPWHTLPPSSQSSAWAGWGLPEMNVSVEFSGRKSRIFD